MKPGLAVLVGFSLAVGGAAALAETVGHWAFQPVASPVVPAPQDREWARHEIDRFILARLESQGLHPSPSADRLTWLRRVSLDLTGLPPTREQVDAFLGEPGNEAHEAVVDALLASPGYGERWAQHWLDVVRYADTHGFEVNTERPNAWPYRDYVIRALNADTPYDRFVREQIVGDALGEDAATGFLVTASVLLPGQIGKDEASIRLARQDALDEIVVNISQTFLGLSVGCARCHDHKFDPVSQVDYFAMQALVAGVEYEDRPLRTPEAEALRQNAGPMRDRVAAIDHELVQFMGTDPGPSFTTAGLAPAAAASAQRLLDEKLALETRLKSSETGQLAFAGKFRSPDAIRLLSRGDPEQPRDPVAPAMLSILGRQAVPPDAPEQDRRRSLADWASRPHNPLTARVMVNRIWQGHFGTGLVETSSDFGRMGTKPSHPELLDWLAAEFIRSGWSMKHLHRIIVLSATYRQQSAPGLTVPTSADAATGPPGADPRFTDADARLLWRFPSRRLEAEAIRDSMLFVSGRLNHRMFGRGFDLFDQRGGLSGFKPVESFSGDGLRRMIYAHKIRREREAVFGAFDCPDAGQSTARRRESTTPLQALNLFNSRFTLEAADALAGRAAREAGPEISAQLTHVWRLALGRSPSTEELDATLSVALAHGLSPVCRALFNSNEFLFIP